MIRIVIAVIVLELAIVSLVMASIRHPVKPSPVVQYCLDKYRGGFWPCSEIDRYEEI